MYATTSFGAMGLNRISRFMINPRDDRDSEDWFELVVSDEGGCGCMRRRIPQVAIGQAKSDAGNRLPVMN